MRLLALLVICGATIALLSSDKYIPNVAAATHSDGRSISDSRDFDYDEKEQWRWNNDKYHKKHSRGQAEILSSAEECARDCRQGTKPKTCYYKFIAEFYSTMSEACETCRTNKTTKFRDDCQCILADGYEKGGLMTINRMYPGPAIIVCKYDKVVVDVENRIPGNAITIHWHGIYQNGYQYADGIPYVTQCPIIEGTTFRYQWKANNAGTHFWHAHTGLHKAEGIQGMLIVREPKTIETNNDYWDHETIDNIIYLTDWFHSTAAQHFPGTINLNPAQLPKNFLVNGMGRQWLSSTDQDATTTTTDFSVNGIRDNSTKNITPPLAYFTVKQGSRNRFRLINACSLACPLTMTIQQHNITVIATDGEPVIPIEVTSITSSSAERYDFVINADKKAANYWIQFRGIGECNPLKLQQLAVIHYESASVGNSITREPPSYDTGLATGIILNQLNIHCDNDDAPNVICVSQLKNAKMVSKEILKRVPDVRLYLGFSFYDYSKTDIFKAGTYKTFLVASGVETVAYVANITNVFPPSPLISQRDDISNEEICSANNIPSTCKGPQPCPCVHVENIPLNSLVELILVDEFGIADLSHPFHLHGYAFHIVGGGSSAKYNVSRFDLSTVRDLDAKGLIKRQLKNPPAKDTFSIPNNGFTIIRFYANNPGYWLFHCHFEFHFAVGMVTVFHVGEPQDLPPVPRGFPKCGNYLPLIR